MVSTCRKGVKGEVWETKVKAKALPEQVGLERDEFVAKGSREGSSRREGARETGSRSLLTWDCLRKGGDTPLRV